MKHLEKFKTFLAFNKSPEPCLKQTSYFSAYDTLLSKYIGKKITFVEVGILDGGSLFMWQEFFGPQARIIGIDLNPNAKKWERFGFEIHIASQSNPESWDTFFKNVGPIDILLDDGGHTYIQQIITAEKSLDHINDGGILIVEDMHTSYMDGFGQKEFSFLNYAKVWIDKINSRYGRFTKEQQDKRVWSVEFFESIIAFKVNRIDSIKSEKIRNMAPNDAKDYRHSDTEGLKENANLISTLITDAFKIYPD